ncbi:hypothetical protein [Thermoflexus hugenholtzii]
MGKVRALWRHYPWRILVVAFLFLLSGNLAASAAWEIILRFSIPAIYFSLLLVFVIIMFISMVILYDFRHQFLKIHAYPREGDPPPHKGILLFLSQPNCQIKINKHGEKIVITDQNNILEINYGEQLTDFVPRLASSWLRKWNWLQIFRGLVPHATRLEYIFVICSEESKKFQEDIETLLSIFFPNNVEIVVSEPCDFNNVDSIRNGLRKGIQEGSNRGFRKTDLVIDITGGTKLSSIAGALYSVEEGIVLQYVKTNPPYNLIYYDIFPKLLDVLY